MTRQREFEPSVRGGFEKDNAFHVRNLNAIKEHLLTAFVGSGQLADGAVTQGALGPGAVTDGAVTDVSVSKLISGIYTAIATLEGAWIAGNLRFDADGITLLDADGGVLVSIPSTSTPFLRGQLEALGLLIEGGLILRGVDNLMEPGARLILGGAGTGTTVGNPPTAPGWKIEWDRSSWPTSGLRRGLFWDATNTSWWTTTNPVSGNPGGIHEFETGTLAALRSLNVSGAEKFYGIVRTGTRVFALFLSTTGQVLIRAYAESTLTYLGQTNLAFGAGPIHGEPGFGTDGTNLFIVDASSDAAGATLRFHKYTIADEPSFVSTTASSGAGNPTATGSFVAVTGFVAAESKWWVSLQVAGLVNRVEAFSTSAVYASNESFVNGGSLVGLAHDGTRFWTGDDAGIVKHTNWKWTTESAVYDVGYTYVDDNGAASVGARPLGAGDFETKSSPLSRLTMKRRAKLRVSAAAIDTATGITHVGWYVNRGNAAPDYQADDAVTDELPTIHIFEDFTVDASPETAPSSNNFPAGSSSFAVLETSTGTPLARGNGLPRVRCRYTAGANLADATITFIRFGTEDFDTDSFHPSTTDNLNATADSSYEFTLPFAGQYLVLVACEFASNGTGRRIVRLNLNGSLYEQDSMAAFTGGAARMSRAFWLDAAAGDKLTIAAFQSSGGLLALNEAKVGISLFGPSV